MARPAPANPVEPARARRLRVIAAEADAARGLHALQAALAVARARGERGVPWRSTGTAGHSRHPIVVLFVNGGRRSVTFEVPSRRMVSRGKTSRRHTVAAPIFLAQYEPEHDPAASAATTPAAATDSPPLAPPPVPPVSVSEPRPLPAPTPAPAATPAPATPPAPTRSEPPRAGTRLEALLAAVGQDRAALREQLDAMRADRRRLAAEVATLKATVLELAQDRDRWRVLATTLQDLLQDAPDR